MSVVYWIAQIISIKWYVPQRPLPETISNARTQHRQIKLYYTTHFYLLTSYDLN